MQEYFIADEKMEAKMGVFCTTWMTGDLLKIKQIRLMISTALGSMLSQQSFKLMNKKEDWDNVMQARYRGSIEQKPYYDVIGESSTSCSIKTEVGGAG